MIDLKTIKTISIKWQTTELNVLREYCQHLFLSKLGQIADAEHISFKGGTALRMIYNSPRFSEDLDFSSSLNPRKIESILIKSFYEIEKMNIEIDVLEAKVTSGGYLATLLFVIGGHKIKVLLEISLRKSKMKGNIVLVNSELSVPYTIGILDEKELVKEKIQALVVRQKPRDYFDLYFILRSNLLSKEGKTIIKQNYQKIISAKIDFKKELKIFLPHSYQRIIKLFPSLLKREIQKQIS